MFFGGFEKNLHSRLFGPHIEVFSPPRLARRSQSRFFRRFPKKEFFASVRLRNVCRRAAQLWLKNTKFPGKRFSVLYYTSGRNDAQLKFRASGIFLLCGRAPGASQQSPQFRPHSSYRQRKEPGDWRGAPENQAEFGGARLRRIVAEISEKPICPLRWSFTTW